MLTYCKTSTSKNLRRNAKLDHITYTIIYVWSETSNAHNSQSLLFPVTWVDYTCLLPAAAGQGRVTSSGH